jgi:threonine/homoserine/homoserine lactone efflux protein
MHGGIATLLLTSLATMGSPGPATIGLVAAGSTQGVRRSLGFLTGIVAGTVAVLVLVATGITAALLAVPALRPVLLGVSAAYILWLAYRVATAPPLDDKASSSAFSLRGATLLALANPKAWVAIAATFASARLVHGAASDALAKTGVLAAMIVLLMTSWLLAGSALAPLLRDPRRSRVVNVVLAAALVAATALALSHE